MGTIDGLVWLMIFLGGGTILSSVTLFLTLTILVFVWRTAAKIVGGFGPGTKKPNSFEPLPVQESTNNVPSSSSG